MDPSKLTPAPWVCRGSYNDRDDPCEDVISKANGNVNVCSDCDEDKADAEFIALARNAFDVMMRRGWDVMKLNGKFAVAINLNGERRFPIEAADPFTALVEADAWYRERVESKETL